MNGGPSSKGVVFPRPQPEARRIQGRHSAWARRKRHVRRWHAGSASPCRLCCAVDRAWQVRTPGLGRGPASGRRPARLPGPAFATPRLLRPCSSLCGHPACLKFRAPPRPPRAAAPAASSRSRRGRRGPRAEGRRSRGPRAELPSHTVRCPACENSCLIHLSSFTVVFGRRASLVLVILSWLEAKVPQFFVKRGDVV